MLDFASTTTTTTTTEPNYTHRFARHFEYAGTDGRLFPSLFLSLSMDHVHIILLLNCFFKRFFFSCFRLILIGRCSCVCERDLSLYELDSRMKKKCIPMRGEKTHSVRFCCFNSVIVEFICRHAMHVTFSGLHRFK